MDAILRQFYFCQIIYFSSSQKRRLLFIRQEILCWSFLRTENVENFKETFYNLKSLKKKLKTSMGTLVNIAT